MQNSDILALAGLRIDGRKGDELRRVNFKLCLANNADGSAYLEQGLNKVLVHVHGPHEPTRRQDTDDLKISCHLVNAPFSATERRKRRVGDRKSAEIEQIVKQSCESVVLANLYPRSEISIVVHVLESDGSLVCTILNAVSLALIDAGISMCDTLVSCSVGFIKENVYQDVTNVEQNSGGAYLPIAIKARTEEVVYIQLDSRLSLDNIEVAISTAVSGCKKLQAIFESGVKQNMRERFASKMV
jgi:exosome complex component RRP41